MSLFGFDQSRDGEGQGGEFFEALERRIVLSAVDGLPDIGELESPDNPVVVFDTSEGDIFVELFPGDAPNTVSNFLQYVERGLYGESFFHRSATGDFDGDGDGDEQIVQGGGFRFSEDNGFDAVFDPDLGPIDQESSRPNTAGTIAMARFTSPDVGIDTATSQFFFNMNDNSFLDDPDPNRPDDEFTVFGQVVGIADGIDADDESWSVLQSIADLSTQDLSGDPAFEGQLDDPFQRPLFQELDQQGDPTGFNTLMDTGMDATGANAMGEIPVRSSFSPSDGFQAEDQVEIVNAQVVKPQDVDPSGMQDPGMAEGFYSQLQVLPEGYASPDSTVTLDLVNPNSEPVGVQVMARYEVSVRDRALDIAELIDQADGEDDGKLAANTSVQIAVHDPATEDESLVRMGQPFALEVYTAAPTDLSETLPVSASLNHYDFEGALSEGFIDVTDSSTRNNMMASDFGGVLLPIAEDDERSFIVWQNLSGSDTTVDVQFFQSGGAQTVTVEDIQLDAYRRGGVDVGTLIEDLESAGVDLDNTSALGVRVMADEPIAAMTSGYLSQSTGENGSTFRTAAGTRGVAGGGLPAGVFPSAVLPAGGEAAISVLNANNNIVGPVRLEATLRDGTEFNNNLELAAVQARSSETVDLREVFPQIADDEPFSLRYIVGSLPSGTSGADVAIHMNTQYRDMSGTGAIQESLASPAQTQASTGAIFSDGFFDYLGSSPDSNFPNNSGEQISIFNPFQQGQALDIEVDFVFGDGTRVDATSITIDSGMGSDVRTLDLSDVVSKVMSGKNMDGQVGDLSNFAIELRGFEGGTSTPAPFVASLSHLDNVGASLGASPFDQVVGATPTLFGDVFDLDDGMFYGGTPA